MFEMTVFEMERGTGFKNTNGEVDLQQKGQMIHCTKRKHTLAGLVVGTQADWKGVLNQLPALQWPLLPVLSSPIGTRSADLWQQQQYISTLTSLHVTCHWHRQ